MVLVVVVLVVVVVGGKVVVVVTMMAGGPDDKGAEPPFPATSSRTSKRSGHSALIRSPSSGAVKPSASASETASRITLRPSKVGTPSISAQVRETRDSSSAPVQAAEIRVRESSSRATLLTDGLLLTLCLVLSQGVRDPPSPSSASF